MTSQHLNIWYTQKTIFVGSLLQGKLDHFDKKNLLDLIALVFLISLIIFDQRTRVLSSTRFLIILMKNGFNMMCFLSKKSYYQKTTRVHLYCDWKDIWSFLKEQSYGLICVVSFLYCKQFWWKSRRV